MKKILIRMQLVFVSVIVLLTLVLTQVIVQRNNKRWDFTHEKMFTLAPETLKILEDMKKDPVKLLVFYPQENEARKEIDVYLKQMQLHHPDFTYDFYDPDRVPRLAKEYRVKDLYTVVVLYQGRFERLARPSEESLTNALYRVSHPETIELCFVTGHGEGLLSNQEEDGYAFLAEALQFNNYQTHEIILSRDLVPPTCSVVIVAGPRRDLPAGDFDQIKQAFDQGKGILFLVDPMQSGEGDSFHAFFKQFGVFLGRDVIVDKMSRMVGGDFLVPLVTRYVSEHPITKDFQLATFYSLARSVQPSTESPADLEVMPLAYTNSGSWAESDLVNLEQGSADFDARTDLAGPLSIGVAVENTSVLRGEKGRMVIIGDSDFIRNSLFDLSGNRDLALNIFRWLSKDDRSVSIKPKYLDYKPLYMTPRQRWIVLGAAVLGIPLVFLFFGLVSILIRRRHS